jgi:hypothetical protein
MQGDNWKMKKELSALNNDVWAAICGDLEGFEVAEEKITDKWRHGTEEEVTVRSESSGKLYKSCFRNSPKEMDFEDMNGEEANFFELKPEKQLKQAAKQIVPATEVNESNDILAQAQRFHIVDSHTCKQGTELAKTAKQVRCKIENYHRPHIDRANKAHKELVRAMKELTEPLKQAENAIKGQVMTYTIKIERLRREAAEKAQREAEEKARKERERLEAEALKAAEEGDNETFSELAAEKEMVSPDDYVPVPEPAENLPEGVSTRKNWQVEITNLDALIQSVIDGKAPKNFITADMKVIGKWAKAVGDSQKVRGIRVYDKGTVSLRA